MENLFRIVVVAMSKILALDLGDAWVGVALTDRDSLFARPHSTVATQDLRSFLMDILSHEQIKKIIIGHPRTMKGGHSAQTDKVVAMKEQLVKEFPNHEFILWDERLSSKRAESLSSDVRSREEKLKTHARAAAFILDSYLTFLQVLSERQATEIDKLG